MNKNAIKINLAIASCSIIMGLFLALWFNSNQNVALGSIDTSNSYYSTSTYYASVSTQANSGVINLKGNQAPSSGVLGSVIITGGPKGGSFALYDATTSNVNLRTGGLSTSTILIAEFPAGIASSTFVYDTTFNNGLLLVTTGTVSTSTITWK